MNKTLSTHQRDFEGIKRTRENGEQYWLARELMPLLEYDNWQNFQTALSRAMQSAEKTI